MSGWLRHGALKTLCFHLCNALNKIPGFSKKKISRNYEKEIIPGTSDAWSMRR